MSDECHREEDQRNASKCCSGEVFGVAHGCLKHPFNTTRVLQAMDAARTRLQEVALEVRIDESYNFGHPTLILRRYPQVHAHTSSGAAASPGAGAQNQTT